MTAVPATELARPRASSTPITTTATAATGPTALAPPTLRAAVGRRTREMDLTDLRVDVRVAGLVAETTLVLTFRNQHNRELEGDLLVPLPDGATLCGFGLDVEGELVDASLVERHRARAVFEHEVRRPKIIDPGLAEHVRGNVFRTRVYPLPARGRRQVMLQYVSDLPVAGGAAVIDLPLPSTGELNRLDVRVEVSRATGHPIAEGDAWGDSAFKPVGDAHVARLHRRHTRPTRLRVVLPDVPASIATTQSTPDGRRYFAIHHVSTNLAGDDLPIRPGQSVRLAWDASLSRAATDKQREFDALRACLRRLGDVEIDLVVFRHRAEPARRFTVADGDAPELLDHLANLTYDGATTLAALTAATTGTVGDTTDYPAYTLLFSDGLITLGPTSPDALPASTTPVFALTAADHADHHLLRRLSVPTGGTLLNLTRLSPDDAAARAGRAPRTLVSVDVLHGSVEDLLPAAPCPVDESFVLTGRLTSDRATVRLNFGHGTTVTDSITHDLGGDALTPGRVIPRLWAQQKAATLSPTTAAGKSALLELGRTFGLVTPGTSLLVLETLWQHLEHRVEPAPTRARLHREYHQALASGHSDPPKPRIDANYDERLEIIRFYARLRLGADVDPTWLATHTEHRTAADICQIIDDATFMARSRGHDKINADDLLSASPLLRASEMRHPLKHHWNTRLAWHDRTFSPPDEPIKTVLPYNSWLATASKASRLSMATDTPIAAFDRGVTIDKTLDRSMDRSIDLGAMGETPRRPATRAATEFDDPAPAAGASPLRLPAIRDQADAESTYLRLRAAHAADPAFYTAWADLFLARGWRDAALRVLSNLAEVAADDAPNLRALAYALEAAGEDPLARDVYEQLLALRPEEPQSHRDLALVLERLGHHQRAADLLAAVATGTWDYRFTGINATALTDLWALCARHRRQHPGAPPLRVDVAGHDLSRPFDLDLRVNLDWNTDMTDLNLWVLEPTGQLATPDVAPDTTRIGGHVPHDMTGGHGPEEYLLRRAAPGTYRVSVQYADDARRRLATPTSCKVTITRNFGRPDERRQVVVLHRTQRPLPAYANNLEPVGCLAIPVAALVLFVVAAIAPQLETVMRAAVPVVCLLGLLWAWWVGRVRRRYQQSVNVFHATDVTIAS